MAITYKEIKLSPTRRDGQLINLTKTTISEGSGGVSSYNNLTDIPSTFAPAVHGNSAHSDYFVNTNELAAAVAGLVDSSPAALNTLNELAAALGDDPNFATTITNQIGLKAPLAGPTFTGTVTSNSYIKCNDNTNKVHILLNGSGANYGVIQSDAANTWSLGYTGTNSSALGTSVLSWNSSGNVGIGTTAPNHTLDIRGGLGIYSSGIDGVLLDTVFFGSPNYPTTFRNKISSSISGEARRSKLIFSLSTGASTYADVLALIGNGNVGIGTTAPSNKFTILHSSTDLSEGAAGFVLYAGYNDTKLQMGAVPAAYSYIQSMRQATDWSSRPLVLQPNGGNVLIGQTTGSEKLCVTGNIVASGDIIAYHA